jgi:glycosyltransferase involved in cell wall biosynthesis
MRIALLHPTYWPEVRRGSERLTHDLGASLAARGHQVTLITSHRGARKETIEDGIRVIRGRRLPEVPGLSWYYDEHVLAIPATVRELLRGDHELVHTLYPTDAWAARLARRRFGGAPYVLSIHGILNRHFLVRRRRRLAMLEAAARDAAAVTALSEPGVAALRRYALASDPVILPGGVIAADYEGEVERPESPTLLCPASLTDPRKRSDLLFEAFELVRERESRARLILAGGADPLQRDPVVNDGGGAVRPGVESVSPRGTDELARAYRSASVTVLPSEDEAFGLVLVESLAAGTPVVAARSGGCPEILTDDRVGRLFDPGDAADLARAIGEALELSAEPATVAACREHAAAWDWSRLVERYEAVYAAALAG